MASPQTKQLLDLLDGFEMTKSQHDWLERRFENMTVKEKLLFRGALQIERPQMTADVMLIANQLDHYELFYGAGDDVQLGKFIMEQIQRPSDQAREFLDPEKVGAAYSQLLSKNIEREMNEDYAVYARCRGLSDMRILWTHALPHALAGLAPSFLQMVGISLAGSAIVEKIFSLPGLGYSIVDSVLYRDTPMIHATILFLAFFLVICNTVSDILQRIFQRGHSEGVVQ